MAQAGASGNLYQGMTETLPQTSVSQQAAVRSTATEQEVARACLALQTLNRLQRLAAAAPASLPADESEVAIRDAKLAMLERIWDADAWGDFETFKQWATGGIADTASPAKAIFEAQSPAFPAGSGISASGSHSLSSV
jgi:predicted aminopeptidase